MSTVSKSFTAVGAGGEFLVRPGESMNYSVSGTFVGTVVLERTRTALQSFDAIVTATAAASGTVKNEGPSAEHYRFRCSAYTSGTIVTALADADLAAKKRIVTGYAKAGATAGWSVGGGAVNTGLLATLPASQTGSTLVVPISGLTPGERLVGFSLTGQIESAGGAVTVDADLRKHTAAAADVADASVGAITQLAVTADTILSKANTRKGALDEIVAEDETFYVLLTATTAAATDIALQGVTVEVMPA
jgi:hypothetical protein